MNIRKAITMLVLAFGLAGCGAADLISNGLSYCRAVETDLEGATGLKPEVSFNWHNGRFEQVTVTFPRLYADKPPGDLAQTVREVVAEEFKQTPDTIMLAFSLTK
jgi:ABC-type glycerol-3-phosphate transport system substrate-binding protein